MEKQRKITIKFYWLLFYNIYINIKKIKQKTIDIWKSSILSPQATKEC